jgi:hypothetical protein
MKLSLSEKTVAAVRSALAIDYFEGAVEAVFEEHPEATRDDVVDTIEELEKS